MSNSRGFFLYFILYVKIFHIQDIVCQRPVKSMTELGSEPMLREKFFETIIKFPAGRQSLGPSSQAGISQLPAPLPARIKAREAQLPARSFPARSWSGGV